MTILTVFLLAVVPMHASPAHAHTMNGFKVTSYTEDYGTETNSHEITWFQNIKGIAVTPEGNVVAAGMDGCTNMFELVDGNFRYEFVEDAITKTAYHTCAAERAGDTTCQTPDGDEKISTAAAIDSKRFIFATKSGVRFLDGAKRGLLFPTTDKVVALACSSEGAITIATDKRVYVQAKNETRFQLLPTSAPALALSFDSNGHLLIVSAQGLDRWDGHTMRHIADLPDGRVQCTSVVIDRTGDIWIGSTTGLLRFNGRTWHTYKDNVLAGNEVNDLACGPDGAIWVATNNGVNRFIRTKP